MTHYALLGYPLSHSFSAHFFTQKFENEGIDAKYYNQEMPDLRNLKAWVETDEALRGFNVTIPHKETILSQLDSISPEAEAIGAVNVVSVLRKEGKIHLRGDNSDYLGFRDSLLPLLKNHHRSALILGTGGSSRAVVYALHLLGIHTTYVTRKKKTGTAKIGTLHVPILQYDELTTQCLRDHTVIVNCTPLGMYPNTKDAPPIPYEALSNEHLVYDLVYNPSETLFLKNARAQSAITKNGLDMLHLQALAAWEIWKQS